MVSTRSKSARRAAQPGPGEAHPHPGVGSDHVVVLRLLDVRRPAGREQGLRGQPVDGELERPALREAVRRPRRPELAGLVVEHARAAPVGRDVDPVDLAAKDERAAVRERVDQGGGRPVGSARPLDAEGDLEENRPPPGPVIRLGLQSGPELLAKASLLARPERRQPGQAPPLRFGARGGEGRVERLARRREALAREGQAPALRQVPERRLEDRVDEVAPIPRVDHEDPIRLLDRLQPVDALEKEPERTGRVPLERRRRQRFRTPARRPGREVRRTP